MRSSIDNQLNQLKKAWCHLSKQQKITLGTLTFVILVLPLSLILIKTQTNLFPKATQPATPPITSPIPETPLSDWCGSCNETVSPSSPYSRCKKGLICKTNVADGRDGAGGICVKPEETTDVCSVSPIPSPTSSIIPSPSILPIPSPSILPIPSPIPTPYPTFLPSPIPTPYPTFFPSPIPTPSDPISLSGDTLPEDPRISYHLLSVNKDLLTIIPDIFTFTAKLFAIGSDQTVLPIENGYGQFFTFYLQPGMKFETLARELDINTVGSYIKTVLYGPDKKKIIQAGTRIEHTATGSGPYYLVVHTFDHKQGKAEVTITNQFRKKLYPYVKLIDHNTELLWDNYSQYDYRLGRKHADFFLQVPQLDNINNIYITYKHQTDENTIKTEIPRVIVSKTCPSNNQVSDVPINIERINRYNIDPLNKIQMKISPQSSAYFPPGYDYTINLEYPDPTVGWTAHFSTTSQSGLMADLNNDTSVDISDFSLLVSEFMQSSNSLISDLNCDGIVDISDYSLLISNISL